MATKGLQSHLISSLFTLSMRAKTFGIVLFILGGILLLNPTSLNLKISFYAVFIGIFLIFFVYNDRETDQSDLRDKNISKRYFFRLKNREY